jgi:hypothetical protein
MGKKTTGGVFKEENAFLCDLVNNFNWVFCYLFVTSITKYFNLDLLCCDPWLVMPRSAC